MVLEVEEFQADGHEADLSRVIDEVEREREEELRSAVGRKVREKIVSSMKAEILRRFAELHPDVEVKFIIGPYADPDAPRGQEGRMR